VIKMVGEMCIGADWAKKWSEQARKCVARLNVWFRSNCIFRRVVEHVEKLLTMIFRLLLSFERLFWGWNTKWVLGGWFVPKEDAWQAWMRFSRLFAVSLRVYLKIDLGGRRNESKNEWEHRDFLGGWCLVGEQS